MSNGKGPFRVLIDTGTGGEALVTPELADELVLPEVGHARLTDPSGLGAQRSDMLLIHSLNLGGAEFADIRVVRHRLYNNEAQCQGVVGFTLFKDYLLTLDYPGRRMILAQGTIRPEEGGAVLPFRMPDGVPIVWLKINGHQTEAQVDTGGTGLSLPEKVASRLKFTSTPIEFASGESLATRFQIKAARLQPDVRLGHYTFKHAFVEINGAFPLVNIGSTPLKSFMVTFDQAKTLVRFYSSKKSLSLDASPSVMQLINQPKKEASDRKLVPVG
jgi:predicted aspartyl protease